VVLRKINIYALRQANARSRSRARTGPPLYMALACPRVRALSAMCFAEDGTRGGGEEWKKMRERSGRPRARDVRSSPIRLIYGSNN